ISLSPEQRKKQLISIVRSFHSLWGKYAREKQDIKMLNEMNNTCLLYTSPSPRDMRRSRMPSSA
ncbi:hypothetical protein PTZ61_27960, partial [Enterobacter hormaechei subsp. steigerwaltii]|nr:hypothetical protein [Enterobacter hormaechei subsp. steigerwaltii]